MRGRAKVSDPVTVACGPAGSYLVHIGVDVLARLPECLPVGCPAIALIADHQVASLYAGRTDAAAGSRVRKERFTFPAGEASKVRGVKGRIEDEMLERGLGRDAVVVGLGGGVSLDLAGFVASTYHRGMPWIAVPTSLLGMVDASVGGKTGVNTQRGKNLIGAFHQPLAVLADIRFLSSLPPAELDNGLAEMVKHAAIADAGYLEELIASAEHLRALAPDACAAAIRRSVEIKAEVVSADPLETDLRQVLNCGHTIAHAIETVSSHQVSHGRAVAAGLSVEAGMACSLGLLEAEQRDHLRSALARLGLPLAPPAEMDLHALVETTRMDKKGRQGKPRYVLLGALGRMARGPDGYAHEVDDVVVVDALKEARKCSA